MAQNLPKGKQSSKFVYMLTKFISVLFLILSFESIAQNATAQNSTSEEWSDTDTWIGGAVPGCFDTLFISAGVYVEIDVTIDLTGCSGIHIVLDGEIHFQTCKKLLLPDGSIVTIGGDGIVSSGNGGGNSNYIEIGGQVVWTAADPDLTGPIELEGPSPLGVGLTLYDISLLHNNDVLIEWETYFETNNSHFEVERKMGNDNWISIAIVNGGLNTQNSIYYKELDLNLPNGQYYYRVTQYDNDGTATVFGIKSIKIGDDYSGIVIVLYNNGTTEKLFQ